MQEREGRSRAMLVLVLKTMTWPRTKPGDSCMAAHHLPKHTAHRTHAD